MKKSAVVCLGLLLTGLVSQGSACLLHQTEHLVLDTKLNHVQLTKSASCYEVEFEVTDKSILEANHLSLELDWSSLPAMVSLRLNKQPVDAVDIDPTLLRNGKNLLQITSSNLAECPLSGVKLNAVPLHSETHDKAVPKVQPDKHPSQHNFDVLHCHLEHKVPNVSSTYLEGVTTVRFRSLVDDLETIALDFNVNGGRMTVSSVQGQTSPSLPSDCWVIYGTPPLSKPIGDLSYQIDSSNEWLIIDLDSPLDTGDIYEVQVTYSGTPSTQSIAYGAPYVSSSTNGTRLIRTFSQPYGARNWWPCKDLPDDKFTINVDLTVPTGQTGVSLGQLTGQQDLGDGYTTFSWEESFPVASYLVSVAVSDYELIGTTYTGLDGTHSMTVGHYLVPASRSPYANAWVGTLAGVEFFAQSFGEYPYLSEKYVTTENDYSGMEHQTATSMTSSGHASDGFASLNIHELAHQWFGDCITPDHYDHIWLNEGFATYCVALFKEHTEGRGAYEAYMSSWPSTINDSTPLVNPNADLMQSTLIYRKGAFVLHMLRHVMGDDKFFQACRNYLQNDKYGNVLTDDLQTAMEGEYGSSLDWFFQQWVYESGRPDYSYSWSVDSTTKSNQLNVTVNQHQGGDAFVMPIDLVVTDLNSQQQTHTVWNDQKTQQFAIDLGGSIPLVVEFDPENYILKDMSSSSTTLDDPHLSTVLSNPDGTQATITWTPPAGGGQTGYQLYQSTDNETWTIFANESTLTASTTSYTLTGLTPGDTRYLMMRAVGDNNATSLITDTYAVKTTTASDKKTLIIDGYYRVFTNRPVYHPYVATHGESLAQAGVGFDSCFRDSVVDGTISLSDYDLIVWVMAEQTSINHTFSAAEQPLTKAYLNAGGQLFVTGAEIGWDLVYRNNGRDFYENYLKANYVADDSEIYRAVGVASGIFDGMDFLYDDGSAGIYYADYPDLISPVNGSELTLNYYQGGGAGVIYEGLFPQGTAPGRLIYIGFGFETIVEKNERQNLMNRAIQFFEME